MSSTAATHRDSHPVHEELAGYEGAKFGMWLFLATELLLFGVMFALYGIFHGRFVDEFKFAHHSLDKTMGGINTIILLVSSFTVAMALDSIQRGKQKRTSVFLMLTIVIASGFLVVKYFEYTGKFHHQVFPGNAKQVVIDNHHTYGPIPKNLIDFETGKEVLRLNPATGKEEPVPLRKQGIDLFFTFYFMMTGVHGAHVLIGMTVLFIIFLKNQRGRYSHWYYTHVENGALYWHLVDLIWIYLFPLFYLIK